MEDEVEIIYLALNNSYVLYNELLENSKDNMSNEEIMQMDYLISRHLELMDKYQKVLGEREHSETNHIKRPSW